jgi:dihydrofolate reductase
MIRLIAAIDRKRGIGKHGGIPWSIPEDEKFFTDQTKTHGGHVLTGGATFRDTYHGGPLKNRHNYILTHDTKPIKGATVVNDLAKFLKEFEGKDLWVAGGSKVFEAVMQASKADELYLTHIDADFSCDRFFPAYEDGFKLVEQSQPREQNGLHFTYTRYVKS